MRNIFLNCFMAAVFFISSSYTIMVAPQLHRLYLRHSVGRSVVKIVTRDLEGRVLGGGTGFALLSATKNNYIVTNAHVCDMYKPNNTATIELSNGDFVNKKIISISEITDLCLIQGSSDLKPLHVASKAYIGETVDIVGHPELMPLNVSEGDILGESISKVGLGIIGLQIKEEDCKQSKNKIMDIDTFFGPVHFCIEEVNSYQTSATALPGNSGSPVVNYWGNVVGVLFAGDNDVHWGLVIPLDDLNDFLVGR